MAALLIDVVWIVDVGWGVGSIVVGMGWGDGSAGRLKTSFIPS